MYMYMYVGAMPTKIAACYPVSIDTCIYDIYAQDEDTHNNLHH